jgi:hypothetical protein
MSSGPSHLVHNIPSTSSPLEDNNTYPSTVPPITSQDPLYSHIFHCDEYILEEITTPNFPWNALHHRDIFLSNESFHSHEANISPMVKIYISIKPGSYKKSPLVLHAPLRNSHITKLSFRNTKIFFHVHIQRFLISILL